MSDTFRLCLVGLGVALFAAGLVWSTEFHQDTAADASYRAFAAECERGSSRFKTGDENGTEGKRVRTFVAVCEARQR